LERRNLDTAEQLTEQALSISERGRPTFECVAKRSVDVDHVTLHRWVQRFTPLLADAARFGRHGVGDRWHVDETYVKIGGRWVYLYRAVDQFGQVIDVYASTRRDTEAVAFPIVLIEHTPGGTIVISQDAANGPNRP
jgi:transposase-like protein